MIEVMPRRGKPRPKICRSRNMSIMCTKAFFNFKRLQCRAYLTKRYHPTFQRAQKSISTRQEVSSTLQAQANPTSQSYHPSPPILLLHRAHVVLANGTLDTPAHRRLRAVPAAVHDELVARALLPVHVALRGLVTRVVAVRATGRATGTRISGRGGLSSSWLCARRCEAVVDVVGRNGRCVLVREWVVEVVRLPGLCGTCRGFGDSGRELDGFTLG